MISLVLYAALAQPIPTEPGVGGPPPVQVLAVINAKGSLAVTRIKPFTPPGVLNPPLPMELPPGLPGAFPPGPIPARDAKKGKIKITTMLITVVELPASAHPYFIGCQFHPEFKSRPTAPHPLFTAFIGAALEHQRARR